MLKNLVAIFFTLCTSFLNAQISLVQFSTGYTAPVDIQNAGDDRLFIVEQGGYIRIADSTGNRYSRPFLDIHSNIVFSGERGLLGLAFDPEYKSNGFFYVNYTAQPSGYTRISRFKVSTDPDSAIAGSEQILLTIYQPYANHNGGGINFNPKDGYLYIGMGDGGSMGDPQNRAQNLDSLLGKMLRIDVSGGGAFTIPADNPFVSKAGRDEIWASGLRNPWRWSFDRWNHDLWIGDVGQGLYEEIDYQKASSKGGENYGWRCYEGNHFYDTAGCGAMSNYIFPVNEHTHSGYAAVIGGYVYRGAEYANMFGKYFFTDQYTTTYGFKMLTPDGAGGFTVASLGSLGRTTVVTFGEDRWGELYVADVSNGRIYKFQGDSCKPVAFLSANDTIVTSCDSTLLYVLRTPAGEGFHYQWFANGSPVGNDADTLVDIGAINYSVVVTNRGGCTDTASTHMIHPGPCVGISEVANALQQVSLFPNPTNGDFKLSFYLSKPEVFDARVVDLIGKTIYQEKLAANAGLNKFSFNLSRLAKGIYNLQLAGVKSSISKRFIVE